jgi:pyridoxine/pyridoxamine 5'-phosphate oxidase
MTLSTVDADGMPDARVLVLKDVDERGWAFASTRSSVKGGQLDDEPHAALTFWWQPVVRSVRIRGRVVEASRDESLADLRARTAAAQDGVDADDWILWRVVPDRIEFWQGSRTATMRASSSLESRTDGDAGCDRQAAGAIVMTTLPAPFWAFSCASAMSLRGSSRSTRGV